MTARCRSCQAAVVWALMPSGKQMPLDAEPSGAGTFVYAEGKGHTATDDDRRRLQLLHTSHFATCPQAASHRKAR